MRKQPLLWLVVLLSALAAGAAGLYWKRAEPSHAGLPLKVWLLRLQQPAQSPEALAALHAMGPQAVPVLQRGLAAHDRAWQRRLYASASKLPFVEIAYEPRAPVRERAAFALGLLGSSALSAIPDLAAALEDPEPAVAFAAGRALIRMGTPALSPLAEMLDRGGVQGRWHASAVIREVLSPQQAELYRLETSWQETSPRTVSVSNPEEGRRLFSALRKSLADLQPSVRENSAAALAVFGSAAVIALEELGQLLGDPHSPARVNAANALGRIGPGAAPAVERLREGLKDPLGIVRMSCALALGRIGKASAPAIPDLVAGLEDPEAAMRDQCAQSLGKIGAGDPGAIQALTTALRSEFVSVRISAAEALGRIGPPSAPAVPALIEALNNDQSGVGRYVRVALRQIAPENDYGLGDGPD